MEMSRKFYLIIFLLLIFLGIGGFIAIRLGLFPVALVNARPISETYFDKAVEEIIGSIAPGAKLPENAELKRQALEKIIENELVYREAKKQFGLELNVEEEQDAAGTSLLNQLAAVNVSFEEWLLGMKRDANIYILVSGFSWSGDGVVFDK